MDMLRMQRFSNPVISRDIRVGHIKKENKNSDLDILNGNCIALIDARFFGWLLAANKADDQVPHPLMPTQELVYKLRYLLAQTGILGQLLRVYWYTTKQPDRLVDHAVIRIVNDLSQDDSGFGTVRAISDDLCQLAISHAAQHVLLASDDERLWAAMDQAQLSGLCVHMLCDDGVNDFVKFQQDDPTWARLLSQADRRVVWTDINTSFTQTENSLAVNSHHISNNLSDARADAIIILDHIARWWSEETESQREELRAELRQSRGIPQELDRLLLLRLSRELGRPLSWPDKKLMREGLRRTILGELRVEFLVSDVIHTDSPA